MIMSEQQQQQQQKAADCENAIDVNCSMAANGDWSLVTIRSDGKENGDGNADFNQPHLKKMSELEHLWWNALFKESEQILGRQLGPVDKYRIRKKHPCPPQTIWDAIPAKSMEEKVMTFLDEKYLKEIVELKVKVLTLTKENMAFDGKLKVAKEKAEMEKNELKQKMEEMAKENAELKAVSKRRFEPPYFQVAYPIENRLNAAKIIAEKAQISPNGLEAEALNGWSQHFYATNGFSIMGENCLPNDTIVYYFEATYKSSSKLRNFGIGLSAGFVPDESSIGHYPNSYALWFGNPFLNLSGKAHYFEYSSGAGTRDVITWNKQEDVIGCGLLMNPKNQLAIFFTVNGMLLGKHVPIGRPSINRLYPTVTAHGNFEANFGGKPFAYDLHKCAGFHAFFGF